MITIIFEPVLTLSVTLLKISFCDYLLCLVFGRAGQWYQLHALINLIVTIEILPIVYEIITEPNSGYNINNYYYDSITDYKLNTSYYVIGLHLYHILMFKNLQLYDWLHHIIFVGVGVVPSMMFIKSNQTVLHKLSCSGIPGIIEYGVLTLYKNNYVSRYNQKLINSILYTYLRLPLCIFGATANYLAYMNGTIKDPLWITIYVNLLLYLNGTVFTQLTNNSFSKEKYKLL